MYSLFHSFFSYANKIKKHESWILSYADYKNASGFY